jgi:hypothetical protein
MQAFLGTTSCGVLGTSAFFATGARRAHTRTPREDTRSRLTTTSAGEAALHPPAQTSRTQTNTHTTTHDGPHAATRLHAAASTPPRQDAAHSHVPWPLSHAVASRTGSAVHVSPQPQQGPDRLTSTRAASAASSHRRRRSGLGGGYCQQCTHQASLVYMSAGGGLWSASAKLGPLTVLNCCSFTQCSTWTGSTSLRSCCVSSSHSALTDCTTCSRAAVRLEGGNAATRARDVCMMDA